MTSTSLDWSPFDRANAIGDPGRQPEIRATSGPLNVGVPDTVLDFLSLGPFELRGCATRGWSHRYKGTPRQDFFSVLVNDDYLIVAVADGVSEGEFSQVAAETAARSACKLVADQLARNGCVDWVQLAGRASMRIIDEAEYRQISVPTEESPSLDDRLRSCLEKMSTTLIVGIVNMTPRAEGFPVEIGVVAGDSAAYVRRIEEDVLVPVGGGKEAGGAITSTRVRPLPGRVDPEANYFFLLPGEALVLGSDGIGDPVGDGTGEVGKEYAARWVSPPTIDAFLLDVNIYRRSFDDDRTAVGVWVRPDVELPVAAPEDEIVAPYPGELLATDTGELVEPADELMALAEAVGSATPPEQMPEAQAAAPDNGPPLVTGPGTEPTHPSAGAGLPTDVEIDTPARPAQPFAIDPATSGVEDPPPAD
ncbi:MAG: protein phosphatase 2C domain-containing protein [Sporichthyaceae bacterium]